MNKVIYIDEENKDQYKDVVDAALMATGDNSNLMIIAKGESNRKSFDPVAMIGDIHIYVAHNADNALVYVNKMPDDALDIAIKNTVENTRICNMSEMIANGVLNPESLKTIDEWEPGAIPLYIITNRDMRNGAGVIFCDEVLRRIYEKIGNFYLLPSSIHEVIITPDDKTMAKNDLNKMVKAINSDIVSPDEKLTDRSFYYNGTLN